MGQQTPSCCNRSPGSGTDYQTTTSGSLAVDATNLMVSRVLPYGPMFLLEARGVGYVSTGGALVTVSLVDTTGPTVLNTTQFSNQVQYPTPWSVEWPLQGDGNSHTFELQFSVSTGSGFVVNQANRVVLMRLQSIPTASEVVT